MKFGAAIPCANEFAFMPAVIGQLAKVCDRIVILRGKKSLSGLDVKLEEVPKATQVAVSGCGAEIVEGEWSGEHGTRNAGMEMLSDCDYVFTIDSDEILSDTAISVLKSHCEAKRPRALLGGCHTYWKTIDWRIDPPEKIVAPLVVRNDVRFERLRMFWGENTVINQYVFHHLSYVRSDEEMKEKLRNFGHADEIVPNWYECVWKRWDGCHEMENLHPTHPDAFKLAVKADSEKLRAILAEHGV